METKRRSLYKALSWRFFATAITMAVAYVITGQIEFALEIGALDTTIKLGAYFMHERAWIRIRWGRVEKSDYQI